MKVFSYLAGKTVSFGKSLFTTGAAKTVKNIFSTGTTGGLRSTGAVSFASASAPSSALILENINKAKTLSLFKDDIIFDELIPLPSKIANALKFSTPAAKFYKSLRTNKAALMKALNITSDEYNQYSALALKISKEESSFGLNRKYKLYHLAERTLLGTKFISTARKFLSGEGFLSLGMTRFKISKAPAEEKELFKQFGITFEKNRSNILKPEQSAVATIIHLANMGKEYPKYLQAVGELMPDLSSPAVIQSLSNARRILFNDSLRPIAIKAVKAGENVDMAVLESAGLSVKDLDDLKTYAKTVILSKDAFLAAKWNGRKFIPIGQGSNYAYANLLNIAAQKGYVSNIDKTSRVLY